MLAVCCCIILIFWSHLYLLLSENNFSFHAFSSFRVKSNCLLCRKLSISIWKKNMAGGLCLCARRIVLFLDSRDIVSKSPWVIKYNIFFTPTMSRDHIERWPIKLYIMVLELFHTSLQTNNSVLIKIWQTYSTTSVWSCIE